MADRAHPQRNEVAIGMGRIALKVTHQLSITLGDGLPAGVSVTIVRPAQGNSTKYPRPARLVSACLGSFHHNLQQHIASCREVLRRCALDFVMADAAFAGHKDHSRGDDARDVDSVVAGAADDVHVGIIQPCRAGANAVDEFRVKRGRLEIGHLRDLLLQIRNFCRYRNVPPEMTKEFIDFAVENYFAVV